MSSRSRRSFTQLRATVFVIILFIITFYVISQLKSTANPLKNTEKNVYMTVVATEDYVTPAKVFAQSLRDTETKHKIVVLVTPNISLQNRKDLNLFFDEIIEVDPIRNPWPNESMVRWNFVFTFTKLRIWQQTKFAKIVFFDADVIVLKNVDELFEYEELSAVEDCCEFFNSGMMVVTPSNKTFHDMMKKLTVIKSHDGGDQGFLNIYFSHWNKLPFFYNALLTTALDKNYRGAFRFQESKIKVLHYVNYKPWQQQIQKEHLDEIALADLHRLYQYWYTVYEHTKVRERSEQ